MGRPLSDPATLKHPRKLRKSTTKPQLKEGVKKPSKAVLAKWKPIVDMCVAAVAANEPLNLQPIKNKVRVKFWKEKPKGWPMGRIVDECDGNIVYEFNAEILLTWLVEQRIAELSPNDIYRLRSSYLIGLAHSVNNYVAIPDLKEYDIDL